MSQTNDSNVFSGCLPIAALRALEPAMSARGREELAQTETSAREAAMASGMTPRQRTELGRYRDRLECERSRLRAVVGRRAASHELLARRTREMLMLDGQVEVAADETGELAVKAVAVWRTSDLATEQLSQAEMVLSRTPEFTKRGLDALKLALRDLQPSIDEIDRTQRRWDQELGAWGRAWDELLGRAVLDGALRLAVLPIERDDELALRLRGVDLKQLDLRTDLLGLRRDLSRAMAELEERPIPKGIGDEDRENLVASRRTALSLYPSVRRHELDLQVVVDFLVAQGEEPNGSGSDGHQELRDALRALIEALEEWQATIGTVERLDWSERELS